MAIIKKGNKELTVLDTQVAKYLEIGYDQIDSTGTVLSKATGGKVYSVAEVNALVEELQGAKRIKNN